jgi:DNA repair exonuclease SbcCD nuclease subunit
MPARPLRFVHASDFHLEMPLQGVVEVPEHLREAFCDAPYTAARRVFDAALAEEAQFLVLSGDLLDPGRAGLRGPLFLVEQFSRLAEQGVAVYWAGGEVDPPEAWPSTFPLPQNVHLFPHGRTGQFVHTPDGTPLVRLVGQSRDGPRPLRPERFEPDPAGLTMIAVANGNIEAAALPDRGICYWALGGRQDRATLPGAPTVVHWPGSPQGRRPSETGIHGCTLVELDENGRARTSLLPTDVIRWLDERLAVDENAGRKDIEAALHQRMYALREAVPKIDLLVGWTLAGSGPLLAELRHGPLAAELLAGLRSEYGSATPATWSVSLEAEPAEALPASLYEQETILGDFLRGVRQYEVNPAEPLELETYLAETHVAGALAAAVSIPDHEARRQVLREAALLGAELLGAESKP